MKKSDLKNGMVVEYRNELKRIVNENQLLNIEFVETCELVNFDDELLRNKRVDSQFDIVKVYPNLSILTGENATPLWEREKEVDWSKVPFGTKVVCWDNEDFKYEGKFVRYDKNETRYPFSALIDENDDDETDMDWKYCKLAEGPKEEVTFDDIDKEMTKYCKKHNEKCNRKCDGCGIKYILDNYNVTRKEK